MSAMKVLAVILGVLMVISGVYCLLFPGMQYWMIAYIVGVCMILDSAGRLAAWWNSRKEGESQGLLLLSGILSLIFGIVLVLSPTLQLAFDLFLIYMMASWVVLLGILRIVHALNLRKLNKTYEKNPLGKSWGIALVLGILMILLGIYSFFHPLVMAMTIGMLIGIGLIIAGVNIIYLGAASSSEPPASE